MKQRGALFSNLAESFTDAHTAFGAVWLAEAGAANVYVIGDEDERPRRIGFEGEINDLESCGQSLWVSQQALDQSGTRFGLRELDPRGSERKIRELRDWPLFLECDGSTLWIVGGEGLLGRIET